jgi:osmotically-inducible protein OsmY
MTLRSAGRACALLGALSAACASTPARVSSAALVAVPDPSALRGPSHESRGLVADRTVVRVLTRELDANRIPIAGSLRVRSDMGIVTLEGDVATRLVRDRAVAVAAVVRGVRAIVDRISVSTPAHTEDVALVAAALLGADPAIDSAQIAVRVRDGIAALTGEVGSEASRRIAERDVLGLPGVREVADDLALRPGERRDPTIARQVERLIHEDPWVDAARVRVGVRDGVALLEGSVRSAAQRARAEADAFAASPIDVVATDLHIDGWVDDGTLRDRPPADVSDAEIERALSEVYALDPRVRPFVPTVEVRVAAVMLTGVAPNAEVERASVEDATLVRGVVRVRDELRPKLLATRAAATAP